jgi:hypothetical protein
MWQLSVVLIWAVLGFESASERNEQHKATNFTVLSIFVKASLQPHMYLAMLGY